MDETFLVLAHARCFPKLIPQSRTIPEYCSSKSISNVFPTLPTIINHGQLPLIYPFLGVAVYGWVTIIYPHHLKIYICIYSLCMPSCNTCSRYFTSSIYLQYTRMICCLSSTNCHTEFRMIPSSGHGNSHRGIVGGSGT